MDAVNPWLDPSEVRHLAEQLIRPVAPAKISAADPGFDSSFVGFVRNDDEPQQPTPAVEDSAVAEENLEKSDQQENTIPPEHHEEPVTAEENLERSDQPENKLPPEDQQEIESSESLLETNEPNEAEPPAMAEEPEKTDPEPPPNPPSQTRFLQRIQIFRDWLAKNFDATDIFILDREGQVIFDESGHGRLHFMARNLAIASRGSSNIHVKIGPAAILEVVPCDTPYGRIVLGALVPESLPPEHMRTIIEVLHQTASPA